MPASKLSTVYSATQSSYCLVHALIDSDSSEDRQLEASSRVTARSTTLPESLLEAESCILDGKGWTDKVGDKEV